MKITYLYHSGFCVELTECVLVFDYYKGELPRFETDKPVYVFASHKHQDHFQMKIFDLTGQYKNIHYFFGPDLKLSAGYLERNGADPSVRERITNLEKRQELEFEGLKIRSLRSTDAGCAFLVETRDKRLYHAGDLNWWHWKGETASWNETMEKDYKREIDSIAGTRFNAAFVPLDPRLEEACGWGMDYFLERTDAEHVFPMHMWDRYECIRKYKETAPQNADKIMEITAPGQVFEL